MKKFRLLFFVFTLFMTLGGGITQAQAVVKPQIAAGVAHTIILKADGTLWASGLNNDGQLGIGTTISHTSAIQVGTDTTWSAVAAGAYHTIALKTNGTLWAWGRNSSGQLGDGTTTDRTSPVQEINNHTDWTTVTAGGAHTIALKTGGTLWAWGANGSGQLGDGTTTSSTSPIQIGTDTNWASVTAGGAHTMALKTIAAETTLWAWGSNDSGQLGIGNTGLYRDSPEKIGLDTTWTVVTAGAYHTIGLKADMTLWAWGLNTDGQLGDGTEITRTSPVPIDSNTDWTTVAAGGAHTVAVQANGTLWAWGYNYYGQLGDGTTTNRNTPGQIGGEANWITVAAGFNHTIGLADSTDSTFWTWGGNYLGQLGDGTFTNRTSPVQIMTPKTLTLNTAGAGSGTVTGGGTYDYGTTQQVTAIADTGSTFTGWSGDCAGTTSPLDVLINRDKTCTATFYKFPWPMFLPAITGGIR